VVAVDLVQTCASEAGRFLAGNCARNLHGWQEVCTCQGQHCNTFSYLRRRMKEYDDDPAVREQVTLAVQVAAALDPAGVEAVTGPDGQPLAAQALQPDLVDRDAMTRGKGQPAGWFGGRRPNMIMLLVVVPLAVGALAVFLIFINYHCKMC